ncbi:MAG: DUF5320 domain-containing protein [Clostridiales bacterium]|nr:DUF5320 domain-containing protein [Clostridiales bacterium]
MPRRDGTGPMGAGPISGSGLGLCKYADDIKSGQKLGLGLGFACRCGFGRGFASNQRSFKTKKELLMEQRNVLKNRLDIIDKQLGNL